MHRRTVSQFLVALLIGLASAFAAAQSPGPATHWVCWYNNDSTLRCVLLQAAADSDAAERAVRIAQPAPGARPLPPHVREIIRAETSLLDIEVIVPLFSEPEGDTLVEHLANYSTCFGKTDCRVTFWWPRSVVAMLE